MASAEGALNGPSIDNPEQSPLNSEIADLKRIMMESQAENREREKRLCTALQTQNTLTEAGKLARVEPGYRFKKPGVEKAYSRTLETAEGVEAIQRQASRLEEDGEDALPKLYELIDAGVGIVHKHLEFEKVSDEYSYEVAEEYLKKKHKGGDQDASLLEGAVKTVELRNGKSSFKRSRSDRPAAGGRGRGGRGQYGMSRFNWSQAAMQMPAQMPMQVPAQQPMNAMPYGYAPQYFGSPAVHSPAQV